MMLQIPLFVSSVRWFATNTTAIWYHLKCNWRWSTA